jgi:uncharacterized Zn finger protein
MTCTRCQGLMVEDQLLDLEGTYGHMWATGSRCLNCGHVDDGMIAQNRQRQQAKVLVVSSGEPDYQDDEVHLGAESYLRLAA